MAPEKNFYLLKDSMRGQWLETRGGLLKVLQRIPLRISRDEASQLKCA